MKSSNSGAACAMMLFALLSGCSAPQGETGDAALTAQVRDALAKDPTLLGGEAVDVSAANGVVYLGGVVDTTAEKAQVASIAGSVPGVRAVKNEIAVAK